MAKTVIICGKCMCGASLIDEENELYQCPNDTCSNKQVTEFNTAEKNGYKYKSIDWHAA